MHASAILALGAAALASAAPTTSQKDTFEVSNFVFGCTSTCDWYMDVSFNGGASYYCKGSLQQTTDYTQCSGEGDEVLAAYIDNFTDNTKNILKLQYEVSNAEEGTRYDYYGEDRVYAATSDDADKQEAQFTVPVSSATGVAK